MYNETRKMADKIINTIKPILLDELTKKIEENKDKFNVVEAGIDDIIKKVKEIVEPISSPIVAGIKLIPFGNPSKRLQELTDDLKLKMDGIDLSELEKIPDLTPEIKIEVKALPQKVKDKLKTLVDDLVSGTPTVEPTTTATKAEPAKTPTVEPTTTATKAEPATTPTTEPAITATAEPAITATAEPTITATAEPAITATAAVAEKSIEEGLSNMPNDDKKETIDKIMKMLEDTGILDEIKKRICTPLVEAEAKVVQAEVVEAQTTNNGNPIATASLAAGGSNKKHRRKTKKNIRRQKRTYTKFGRNF